MANWFLTPHPSVIRPTAQTVKQITGAVAIAFALWSTPALAQDPFRTTNRAAIDNSTEAAFKSVFEKGNYTAAEEQIKAASTTEPLANALNALLAYNSWQGAESSKRAAWADTFRSYAQQTREKAEQIKATSPLRGNLYVAVGNFLEGAHIVGTQGVVRGTPQALGKLQQAFQALDAAEKIDPKDPELNLIKGYMDLMLAANFNLPLSSPAQAIDRLEKLAQPRYLAFRGLALGYRDLKQPDKAMVAIDQALKSSSDSADNPELLYLKGQILVRQGKLQDSVPLFQKALTKEKQLPKGVTSEIKQWLANTQAKLGTPAKK
jgi:tetratricopeptide (TPR) repeat protein